LFQFIVQSSKIDEGQVTIEELPRENGGRGGKEGGESENIGG
jgi:hypothetical protein